MTNSDLHALYYTVCAHPRYLTGYLALPLKVSHMFLFPSCMLVCGTLRRDKTSCHRTSQHYEALCFVNSLKWQLRITDTFIMLIGTYKCFLGGDFKRGGCERHTDNFVNCTIFIAFYWGWGRRADIANTEWNFFHLWKRRFHIRRHIV